jgi:hypothetical protein
MKNLNIENSMEHPIDAPDTPQPPFAQPKPLRRRIALLQSAMFKNALLVSAAFLVALTFIARDSFGHETNPIDKLGYTANNVFGLYNGICYQTDYVEEYGCSVSNTGPNCTTYVDIGGTEVPLDARKKPTGSGQCSLILKLPN